MAHVFNLWTPHLAGERLLEVDVTQAEFFKVGDGSADWIVALLAAIGVPSSALRWSIRPSRSRYYSSYPDEHDWRDRWTKCWTVRIELDSAPDVARFVQPPPVGPIPLEATDGTATKDDGEGPYRGAVLCIADIRRDDRDATAIADDLAERLTVTAIERTDRTYAQFRQLRLLLPSVEIPEGESALDRWEAEARAQDVRVHWRGREGKHSKTVLADIEAWKAQLPPGLGGVKK